MTQDAKDLLTVRDFIRYAVSRFNQAELFYGHGTFDAVEEAVFLVAETLHLPFGPMDTWWEARLTATERKAVADIIDTSSLRQPQFRVEWNYRRTRMPWPTSISLKAA